MRKSILLFVTCCFAMWAQAATSLTVSSTAGGLSKAIVKAGGSIATVTDLTVTGKIDASDFKMMRDSMTALSTLDLSQASISIYLGTNGPFEYITGYEANVIPINALTKSGITSISLPASAVEIENGAFSNCTKLKTVTIPSSIKQIDDYVFSGCSSLTFAAIPSSVTTMGNHVFSDCTALGSVTFASSVSPITLGVFLFSGCSSLQSVSLPNNLQSIPDEMFLSCSSLTSISLPVTVTQIGSSSFAICPALASITIPSAVTSIGSNSFSSCTSLKTITIPPSVTSIGQFAFESCSSLSSVSFSKQSALTSIGGDAFMDCKSLLSLDIPNSVKTLGPEIFYDCSLLSSVSMPDSLEIIGSSAFSGCSALKSIYIPAKVDSIGDYAFSGCSALASVKVNKTVPVSLNYSTNAFQSVSTYTCSLYVPSGAKANYASAKVWSNFKNIIEGTVVKDTIKAVLAKTVNIKAGGLSAALTSAEKKSIVSLTITGTIDARDFKIIRDSLPLLTSIDLSAATIVAYDGTGGTYGNPCSYEANEIPEYAFKNSSITQIILPTNLTSIGIYAFYKCASLHSVDFPSSVSRIESYAFTHSGLTTVTLPSSVIELYDSAFAYCSYLRTVKTYAYISVSYNVGKGIFYESTDNDNFVLHVPIGQKAMYEEHNPWSFFDYIVDDLVVSGIQETKAESSLKTNISNGNLAVSGITSGTVINVYNLQGTAIYSQKSGNETVNINLPCHGVYVVKVGSQSKKVIY